jgi:hypothetical protein
MSPTYWQLPAGTDLAIWQSPGLDRLAARFLIADASSEIPGTAVPFSTGTTSAPLPDQPVSVELPGGPLRGLALEWPTAAAGAFNGWLVADLHDADGTPVAATRRLVRSDRPQPSLFVPVAGEDPGTGPLTLRLSWEGDTPAPVFRVDDEGVPGLTLIRPADDGLSLASDDNGAVWERTTSLPRIRWAGAAQVIEDPEERADTVAGTDVPADTVVLSEPGGTTDGQDATLDVREDSGDTVRVDVDAGGAGYLVLAEAVQSDWTVTVDGRAATVEDADHAFGAVHVPAGQHDVVFTYAPRGQTVGYLVSALSALVALGLAASPYVRRRPSRRPQGSTQS